VGDRVEMTVSGLVSGESQVDLWWNENSFDGKLAGKLIRGWILGQEYCVGFSCEHKSKTARTVLEERC
jgi:hypothetical protein